MSKRVKNIILWAAVILILGACALGLYFSGFFEVVGSAEAMRDYINRSAPWSHLVFFLLQYVSSVLAPIPNNITALAGAMIFGAVPAFFLTWAGVLASSITVFFLARALGQERISAFLGRKMSDRYLDLIRRKQDSFLFMSFLLPFFPDDVICILAGLTDISWKRFLTLILIARPWGLLVSCAVGGSVLNIPLWGMILLGVAGVAIFVLAMIYGDRIEEKLVEKFKR